MDKISWKWLKFDEISGPEMHEIMAVRQQVFVLEQQCIYLDADKYDQDSFHLTGRAVNGNLVVYTRLNFPRSRFPEPSIGRILTVQGFRKRGFAQQAVNMAIRKCQEEFSATTLRISAQMYLKDFYADIGFNVKGKPYDEDGITHIDMVLEF